MEIAVWTVQRVDDDLEVFWPVRVEVYIGLDYVLDVSRFWIVKCSFFNILQFTCRLIHMTCKNYKQKISEFLYICIFLGQNTIQL